MSPTHEGTRRNLYRGIRLNATNYTAWRYSMKIHLRSVELWKYVEDPSLPDSQDRVKCHDQIVMGLDDEQLLLVVECDSPYEVWNAIETEHRRGTAENILYIRQDFLTKKWDGKSDVKLYLEEMREMSLRLNSVGAPVSEQELCLSILMGVQTQIPEYQNAVGTLTIGRTASLRYGDVRSALLTAEQTYRRAHPNGREQHGFVTYHARQSRPARAPSRHLAAMRSHNGKKPVGDRRCFNCNRPGHFARDCRSPKAEQANLATRSQPIKRGDSDENLPSSQRALIVQLAKRFFPQPSVRRWCAIRVRPLT